MKNKLTIQNIYIFFLIANVILLIAGALTVREGKFNLGESEPYREIVPVSCERTQDGRRLYTFDITSDGMDNALMFFTSHQEIWAYADGELIYSRGKVDTIFSHSAGSIRNIMSFPPDTKELVIMLKAVYPFGEDDEYTFYQGNGIHMFRKVLEGSVLSIVICALIIMAGIGMIIYWAMLYRKRQDVKDLLYMGIFVLLVGMWTLGDVNGVAILLDCRPYASYFSYVLLMLMSSTFLLFIKYFLDAEDRYIHKILAIYSFGAMFVSIILQCLNIADFKQTVLLTHIALILDLLYLLFIIWDKMRKGKTIRKVRLNLLGLIVLFIAVFVELYAYYNQLKNLQVIGTFGFLIYIALLGMEICASAADMLEEGQKAEIYKYLAEKDLLTKCYNRNAYNEDIRTKVLDRDVYVIIFDLNDLKKCNDTLGHLEGDRYLTDSAELIKKTFGECGKIYRIGGDEFCIITDNVSAEEISGFIGQFTSGEDDYNQRSQSIHMQIAVGFARYDPEKDADLDQTRCRADALMYENKKKLKETVGENR